MSEVEKLKKALNFLTSHLPGVSELTEIATEGSLVMDSQHVTSPEKILLNDDTSKDTLDNSQRMLDKFRDKKLNNLEVGRLYERYIGYLYEQDGWAVTFKGIIDGFDDMGRDLVCIKGQEHRIVQAKCWSRHKPVRENHVFQLHASTTHYRMELRRALRTAHGRPRARAIMKTTTIIPTMCINNNLSPEAEEVCKFLNIEYQQRKLDKTYPMIKCNVSTTTGEKLYHLPFDRAYDTIIIGNMPGEKYVSSVREAETLGFRRAG